MVTDAFFLHALDVGASEACAASLEDAILRAEMLQRSGEREAADVGWARVREMCADDAAALVLAGERAMHARSSTQAVGLLARACELMPGDAHVWLATGSALIDANLYKFAILHLSRCIELGGPQSKAQSQRALAYMRLGEFAMAQDDLRAAILEDPRCAPAHMHQGTILSLRGNLEAAEDCYDLAIACDPELAEAHFFKSVLMLSDGRFEQGWREHEWRVRARKWSSSSVPGAGRRWDGRPTDRPLLVRREQGPGEQVLFGSLLEELHGRAPRLTVTLDRRLLPLFRRSFAGIDFVDDKEPLDATAFDHEVLMGSIPQYFRKDWEDFRASRLPHLRWDEQRRVGCLRELGGRERLLCGISWSSINPVLGAQKNVKLMELAPLLRTPDATFIDLQYGDTSGERARVFACEGIEVRKLESIDNRNDLDGLAALIGACDVIVTTSNTTAHLAGALGKPVLLLAPRGRQVIWYWTAIEGRCIWYPSVQVFEQHVAGDWSGCIADVRRAIEDLACRLK